MRRLILVSTLAVSTVIIGACSGTENVPNKPVATPSPVQSASPMSSPAASPAASPATSPAKPGTSPEVKKEDTKTGGGTNVKPTETPKK